MLTLARGYTSLFENLYVKKKNLRRNSDHKYNEKLLA